MARGHLCYVDSLPNMLVYIVSADKGISFSVLVFVYLI